MAKAVEKLVKNEPAHLAILGTGGMGKTALALYIIKDLKVKEKFEGRIYFVPCEICTDAPNAHLHIAYSTSVHSCYPKPGQSRSSPDSYS